jgi:predicted O-methyltransferase YrrM
MNKLKPVAIALASGGLLLFVLVAILAPVYPWGAVLLSLASIGVLSALLLLLFFNLRKHIDLQERQTLALHSAIALTQIQLPRPAFFLRHAVAPDFVELVSEIIRRRGVRSILELGCGTSSLYFASLLAPQEDGGKLVCLENSTEWAQLVQTEIDRLQQPQPGVRVAHAPLITLPEGGPEFYDLGQVPLEHDAPFDLLVVDGPSDVNCRKAAFDILPRFLTPAAVIVLDDGREPAICNAVKDWLQASPGWSARYYDTVKGTWVLWQVESPLGIPFP